MSNQPMWSRNTLKLSSSQHASLIRTLLVLGLLIGCIGLAFAFAGFGLANAKGVSTIPHHSSVAVPTDVSRPAAQSSSKPCHGSCIQQQSNAGSEVNLCVLQQNGDNSAASSACKTPTVALPQPGTSTCPQQSATGSSSQTCSPQGVDGSCTNDPQNPCNTTPDGKGGTEFPEMPNTGSH